MLLSSGCFRFYRNQTLEADAVPGTSSWPDVLRAQAQQHPLVFAVHQDQLYLISQAQWGEETITGEALPQSAQLPSPIPRNIRRGKLSDAMHDTYGHSIFLYTRQPLSQGRIELDLHQVQRVLVPEPNVGANLAANGFTFLGSAVVGFGAFLAIACNCPRVYLEDDTGQRTSQGSLLTGAISQSLAREDRLLLPGVDRSQERFRVVVANELPEDEYLDQLKLYRVPVPEGETMTYGTDGELYATAGWQQAQAATNQVGTDVSAALLAADEVRFVFDGEPTDTSLNAVHLTFDRTTLGQQPHLVLRARQTDWMLSMGEQFFNLLGRGYDRWMKRMDEVDPVTYAANTAERGMSMRAWLRTAQGWQLVGTFHNAGTRQPKLMSLALDLSQVSGPTVEIRLESAYRFWELDEVALANEAQVLVGYQEVPLLSATNERGEDVAAMVAEQDQHYAVQPDAGSFIELEFPQVAQPNEAYVLMTHGYYHHLRDQEQPANWATLRWLKSSPLHTQAMSYWLYHATRPSSTATTYAP